MSEASPFAFSPHPAVWAGLAVVTVAVVAAHRHLARRAGHLLPWPAAEVRRFVAALLVAAAALTWPLGDLAAHWSLTALIVQRLALVLGVAPLLLLGVPYDVLDRATRPRPVDAALTRLRHPAVAVAACTALSIGTLVAPVVAAEASSPLARAGVDVAVVLSGVVLWVPVLGRVPGLPRLRPVGRFAYLVVQAVVPAFLSVIYIFARHPLYPTFAGSKRAVGLLPLTDQQVAGFVSKLGTLFPLLIVGAVVLLRAQRAAEAEAEEEDPLLWADVERQLVRVDRRGGPPGPAPVAAPRATRTAEPPTDAGSGSDSTP